MRQAFMCVVIVVVLLGALGTTSGSIPWPGTVFERLVHRADVEEQFQDNALGRFDANVFLFTCVLLTPFACLALAITIALSHMVLEATVLPVGRRLGMSDGATVVIVLLGAATFAYARADLWLPSSIRLIALIARAWVVSTT